MAEVTYDSLEIGHELPPLELPPITRTTLALYAGASGDHNPIHIDTDFAKKAGLEDVFAHGMLSMAYMSRIVTKWVGPHQLRELTGRFTAITHVHDRPKVTAKIIDKSDAEGERRVRLRIDVTDQNGETKIKGTAIVALP